MYERLCRISFSPSGRTLEVPAGTSLFEATRRARLPLAASCDGDAICGKCMVVVLEGASSLTPITSEEIRLLQKYGGDYPSRIRIACQAWVEGDVTITTTYWGEPREEPKRSA